MHVPKSTERLAALSLSLLGFLLVAGQCGAAVNAPPVISNVPDRSTPMGETIDVPFSIVDETPSTVVVSASSDDETLVPNADIAVLGSGADRTVRITPSPLGTGSAIITLVAQDGAGHESEGAFALEVTFPFQTQMPKLTANDGANGDHFGYSVAISGDFAIIGAPDDDLSGTDEGSAYVFERNGGTWIEVDKLTASDGASNDMFGSSVAISGDYALVGSPYDDLTGGTEGTAYVFERNGSTWTEVANLTASDAASGDLFGSSVAISGDYAIVGANFDDLSGTDEGSAYVFERNGSTWIEVDKLTANDAADSDYFGFSTAIDGDYAIVGAHFDDLSGTNEGSAYVFERNGSTWAEVDKLTASDAATSDLFGTSVAIRGDYAIIGSRLDDLTGSNEGSAYVFKRSGSAWTEIEKLTASDATDNEYFGFSVAISEGYALIGAYWDDLALSGEGSGYVFVK